MLELGVGLRGFVLYLFSSNISSCMHLQGASDKSNSLLAMAVGISQKKNVDNIVRKVIKHMIA